MHLVVILFKTKAFRKASPQIRFELHGISVRGYSVRVTEIVVDALKAWILTYARSALSQTFPICGGRCSNAESGFEPRLFDGHRQFKALTISWFCSCSNDRAQGAQSWHSLSPAIDHFFSSISSSHELVSPFLQQYNQVLLSSRMDPKDEKAYRQDYI